ncbi:hypothetical protein KSD_72750 [Ktedonobacter sp. SOSP1-85]|nr:hypothetical protein KSD_72750 [Ktedonobacter sp. SOSP1-85]
MASSSIPPYSDTITCWTIVPVAPCTIVLLSYIFPSLDHFLQTPQVAILILSFVIYWDPLGFAEYKYFCSHAYTRPLVLLYVVFKARLIECRDILIPEIEIVEAETKVGFPRGNVVNGFAQGSFIITKEEEVRLALLIQCTTHWFEKPRPIFHGVQIHT